MGDEQPNSVMDQLIALPQNAQAQIGLGQARRSVKSPRHLIVQNRAVDSKLRQQFFKGASWLKEAFFIDCRRNRTRVRDRRNKTESSEFDPGHIFGPGYSVTNAEVRRMYASEIGDHPELLAGILFVVNLGLVMNHSGHFTFKTKYFMHKAAEHLDLPSIDVTFTLETMVVSFGLGPRRTFPSNPGYDAGRLLDMLQDLGKDCLDLAPERACVVLDHVMDEGAVFGWFVDLLNNALFKIMVPVAFFGGDINDSATAACIFPFLYASEKLFPSQASVLKPFLVGVLLPLFQLHLLPTESCHARTVYLSLVLFDLPAVSFLAAPLEIRGGDINLGVSRVISALVKIMSIAVLITVGWQIFGHGTDAQSSLVPTDRCPAYPDVDWKIKAGLLSLIPTNANIVLSKVPLHTLFFVTPITMGFIMFDSFLRNEVPTLPVQVMNFLGIFVASFCSFAGEYWLNIPTIVTIFPFVLVAAPGASCLFAVLQSMGAVQEIVATFFLIGISYSAGIASSQMLWWPIMYKGHRPKQPKLPINREKEQVLDLDNENDNGNDQGELCQ
mmetsp:Transcript_1651/g.3118  ORF Transcript_1651/g.3118 Transcript_1651/m.3118 type:complete len:555 (+) Transcript_1651:32-1696(+)|eukprot:CAMPEP_0175120452 /NCGR_PEP_ID=MMETSP0087-20121206/629_1 /TAXON_ID=136419 /ORGANISM="Unknown Unknown, Strain D1" /LENGTH=554 /DNA_ID=CAMNT_0016401901 /DNA_START=8 /DNA_END=1672 /DNA_ORIENTATION=-